MRSPIHRSTYADGSRVVELRLDPVCRLAFCFEVDGSVHAHVVAKYYQNSWILRKARTVP
jgi:hypothetical protein